MNVNGSGTGAISAQGTVTTTSNQVAGNIPITLSGSAAQTITQSGSNTFPTGNWTISKSGGTATLASGLTINSSNQSLTITGGTLDLAGFPLTIGSSGILSMTGGTLNVQGAELIRAGTATLNAPTLTGGTINYYGSGTYAKMILGTTYYNLTISGTGNWTAATASAVLGTFSQSAGTYIAPSTLTIGGGFSTSGRTFNTNSGTVVFNNSTQTSIITGANTFYNLSVNTPSKILTFPASTTTTVTHALTLSGSPDGRVTLRSSSPGTQADLTVTGSYTLNALDVEDSNACGSTTTPLPAAASIDSGDNSCWSFQSEESWYNPSWLYRKEIFIDHTKVPADQTNFPVLITWSSDPSVQAHAQPSGNDLLFTSVDGVTKLLHEIETYNSSTGELEAWVKVPSLSSSQDTILWMYYGNPSASNQQASPISSVWSDNYLGVWHLKENATGYPTTGEYVDSMGVNNLTAGQNTHKPTQTTGQISFGQLFNSANATVATNSAVSSLGNVNDTKTVTLWYEVTANPGSEQTLLNLQNSTADSLTDRIEFTSAGAFGAVTHNGTQLVTTTAPVANAWHYIAWMYNSSGAANNLSIDAGTPVSHSHAADSAAIGVISFGGNFTGGGSTSKSFGGSLDEVRIANSVLSASWLQTEYNNESSPSTFERFVSGNVLEVLHGVQIKQGVQIRSN